MEEDDDDIEVLYVKKTPAIADNADKNEQPRVQAEATSVRSTRVVLPPAADDATAREQPASLSSWTPSKSATTTRLVQTRYCIVNAPPKVDAQAQATRSAAALPSGNAKQQPRIRVRPSSALLATPTSSTPSLIAAGAFLSQADGIKKGASPSSAAHRRPLRLATWRVNALPSKADTPEGSILVKHMRQNRIDVVALHGHASWSGVKPFDCSGVGAYDYGGFQVALSGDAPHCSAGFAVGGGVVLDEESLLMFGSIARLLVRAQPRDLCIVCANAPGPGGSLASPTPDDFYVNLGRTLEATPRDAALVVVGNLGEHAEDAVRLGLLALRHGLVQHTAEAPTTILSRIDAMRSASKLAGPEVIPRRELFLVRRDQSTIVRYVSPATSTKSSRSLQTHHCTAVLEVDVAWALAAKKTSTAATARGEKRKSCTPLPVSQSKRRAELWHQPVVHDANVNCTSVV